MRVLLVAHVGETVGHLVRGLAIADSLRANGVQVEIACSARAEWLLQTWENPYVVHYIPWEFSHNGMSLDGVSVRTQEQISRTNDELLRVLRRHSPDLIIGLPGLFSVQVARHFRIPHMSVLHGPYLASICTPEEPTLAESTIRRVMARFVSNCVNPIYKSLSKTLGFSGLSYDEYLASETLVVPQPTLGLPAWENIVKTGFVRASFGSAVQAEPSWQSEAAYITFGSGNTCDLSTIVSETERHFPIVIVSAGKNLVTATKSRVVRPFIASSSLAGRVRAVITHGGIGTVGTFAASSTPMLLVPTEVDQATMAAHASRAGLAIEYGLADWVKRACLGRALTALQQPLLAQALERLKSFRPSLAVDTNGAVDIARYVAAGSLPDRARVVQSVTT